MPILRTNVVSPRASNAARRRLASKLRGGASSDDCYRAIEDRTRPAAKRVAELMQQSVSSALRAVLHAVNSGGTRSSALIARDWVGRAKRQCSGGRAK